MVELQNFLNTPRIFWLFAVPDANTFEESVKKAIVQIEESPFMKRTEMASAEQYFQVSATTCYASV